MDRSRADSSQRHIIAQSHVPIRECPYLARFLNEAHPHQIGLRPVIDQEFGNALTLRGLQPDQLFNFVDHGQGWIGAGVLADTVSDAGQSRVIISAAFPPSRS